MGIISKLEKASNTDNPDSYFEQRATNESEAQTYYFNQPVIKFPINEANKLVAKEITDKMFKAIEGCGIGLAHNQLKREGEAVNPYAIFVIDSPTPEYHASREAFINPIIAGYTTKKVGFYHGCLSALSKPNSPDSIPEKMLRAKVATFEEILIVFYSPDLEIQVKKYTYMAAIIGQHEFNHVATRGTYVDRVNHHVNGNRFSHAEEFYVEDAVIEQSDEKGIIQNVGEDIPCLITTEVLSRCKKALEEEPLYKVAVTNYLQDHPE